MNSVKIRANAKVNLWLDITGKRPDGYHTLQTVMLSVGIADLVTLVRRESGIAVHCSDANVPVGERNIACKAAAAFLRQSGLPGGVDITLEKNIPMQAGLGGGSADAAAALWGMNVLFGMPVSTAELTAIAASVGADVPFCLFGGCAELSGIGDIFESRFELPDVWLTVVKIPGGISTPTAYGFLDTLQIIGKKEVDLMQGLRQKLLSGDSLCETGTLCNIFEAALPALSPETDAVLNEMRALTPSALLCGSGNAVFGLFADREGAKNAANWMKNKYPEAFCTVVSPEPKALIMEEMI